MMSRFAATRVAGFDVGCTASVGRWNSSVYGRGVVVSNLTACCTKCRAVSSCSASVEVSCTRLYSPACTVVQRKSCSADSARGCSDMSPIASRRSRYLSKPGAAVAMRPPRRKLIRTIRPLLQSMPNSKPSEPAVLIVTMDCVWITPGSSISTPPSSDTRLRAI